MELSSIKGIGPAKQEKLEKAGIKLVRDLVDADLAKLSEETGISHETLKNYQEQAVGQALISDAKHLGPESLRTLADAGITSLKDLAMRGKNLLQREAEELSKRTDLLKNKAVEVAKHVRDEAKTADGRKKLVEEAKETAQTVAKSTEAHAKDAYAKARHTGEDAIARALELKEKAPEQFNELKEKAEALVKEMEAKARDVSTKAETFVKTEAEKVKAQAQDLTKRVRKSD